jgi:hypothetical protein
MEGIIQTYLTGLLVTLTILLIWFYSPLKSTIGGFLSPEIYLNEQFDTYLLVRNKWIGKLASCYICFSFWTSMLVGLITAIMYNYSFLYGLLTALTYPSVAYLYKTWIEKKAQ